MRRQCISLAVLLLTVASCGRPQKIEEAPKTETRLTESEKESIRKGEAKAEFDEVMAIIANSHPEAQFWSKTSDVRDMDGQPMTLVLQDRAQQFREKAAIIHVDIHDVYRVNNEYRVLCIDYMSGVEEYFLLDCTEKQARSIMKVNSGYQSHETFLIVCRVVDSVVAYDRLRDASYYVESYQQEYTGHVSAELYEEQLYPRVYFTGVCLDAHHMKVFRYRDLENVD